MTNFVYGFLYLQSYSNMTGDKMANSVNYQLLKLYWMRNKHQFGVRSKLYIYNFICMTVFGIVFLVSLCCSFKKINMFSFQKHYYVLIILKFFPKFWVNTISISKITVKQVVWKHLFVIYLRLLPVFSINRAGWGDEGLVSKISLRNRWRGHIANFTDHYKWRTEGQILAKNNVT